MAIKDLAIKLLISARDEASGTINRLSKHINGLAASVLGIGAAGWGLDKLWKSLSAGAAAAGQGEQNLNILKTTLEATGYAAGMSADDVARLANEIDKSTTLGKGQAREGAEILATLKSISGDLWKDIELAADGMQKAGFGEYTANVKALGKAFEDPVKGLTLLGRQGVTFTEQEQEVIKGLTAMGEKAQAQGIILDALKGQIGDIAEAASQGYAGSVNQLEKAQKQAGKAFNAGLLEPMTKVNEAVAYFWNELARTDAAKNVGAAVGSALNAVVDAGLALIGKVDFKALAEDIKNSGQDIAAYLRDLGTKFKGLAQDFADAWTLAKIIGEAGAVVWNTFRSGIESAAAASMLLLAAQTKLMALIAKARANDDPSHNTREAALAESLNASADLYFQMAKDFGAASLEHLKKAGSAFVAAGENAGQLSKKTDEAGQSLERTGNKAKEAEGKVRKLTQAEQELKDATDKAANNQLAANMDAIRVAGERTADALRKVADQEKAFQEKIYEAEIKKNKVSPDQEAYSAIANARRSIADNHWSDAADWLARAGGAADKLIETDTEMSKYWRAQIRELALVIEADTQSRKERAEASGGPIDKESSKLRSALGANGDIDMAGKKGLDYIDARRRANEAETQYRKDGLSEEAARKKADEEIRKPAGIITRPTAAPHDEAKRAPSGSIQYIPEGVSPKTLARDPAREGTAPPPTTAPAADAPATQPAGKWLNVETPEDRAKMIEASLRPKWGDKAAADFADEYRRKYGQGAGHQAPAADQSSGLSWETPDAKKAAESRGAGKLPFAVSVSPDQVHEEVTKALAGKPVAITVDAEKAAQSIFDSIAAKLQNAGFQVPVRAVITVDAGGATQTAGDPIGTAAAKLGTRIQ
ncbi:phage tail length tape measure family protein [uncultured Thiodictyon sp.]|uniref:phage tail length tape measure family protein n=1 Tax=uncultured Thiodictyon sp. TaxID=1846217 RepID=UPI002601409B|nr:phage tail length tape measure family protein [uncultured Thiodictyon sp.]